MDSTTKRRHHGCISKLLVINLIVGIATGLISSLGFGKLHIWQTVEIGSENDNQNQSRHKINDGAYVSGLLPVMNRINRQEVIVFLGAGFSAVAGVPLAAALFDDEPVVDRIARQRLVQRVRAGWLNWHERTQGAPEEYLSYLEQRGGPSWRDAVWY